MVRSLFGFALIRLACGAAHSNLSFHFITARKLLGNEFASPMRVHRTSFIRVERHVGMPARAILPLLFTSYDTYQRICFIFLGRIIYLNRSKYVLAKMVSQREASKDSGRKSSR